MDLIEKERRWVEKRCDLFNMSENELARAGSVLWVSEAPRVDVDEACARNEIPPEDIVCRFGAWVVTTHGLECLSYAYSIEADRLRAQDWIVHMSEKGWVGLDFLPAYVAACEHHGIDNSYIRRVSALLNHSPVESRLARKRAKSTFARGSLRYRVLERDGFRCVACGRSAEHGVVLHVDHIVPIASGGLNIEPNLRTLCEECNLGKGKYDPSRSQLA